MEDGKKRHLFQLDSKKSEVLQLLPDPILKQYLDFMKHTIEDNGCLASLFSCFRKKH
jgi:hypothetical protein